MNPTTFAAVNRLAKWRTILTGWQIGTGGAGKACWLRVIGSSSQTGVCDFGGTLEK